MKVIEVKKAEPTIILELTQSELGTLIAGFGKTNGTERDEFAIANKVKVLDYRCRWQDADGSSAFYNELVDFYKKTFN